jgi:methionyl aminopeptidase
MENIVNAKQKEAGKALSEAILKAKSLVKPGNKLIDVANAAEGYLKSNGYGLAFPMNISINEQAAHYTPSLGDEKVFSASDVVKLDFGSEKGGFLCDAAITVDLSGKYGGLVAATEEALSNAISMVKAGIAINEIGRTIAQTIEARIFPDKEPGRSRRDGARAPHRAFHTELRQRRRHDTGRRHGPSA